MASTTRLYPILKRVDLDDKVASEFVEILEEKKTEGIATKEDIAGVKEEIAKLEVRGYKSMIVQTGIIIGAIVTLLNMYLVSSLK